MTISRTTHLGDIIGREIKTSGPISVERYMDLCLNHPTHGVYGSRDPIGARGDFVTAPEISQIFGELLGLWCADIWHKMACPDPFYLIELGPGHGTLMADALRAAASAPGFAKAISVHLVETSPILRDRQADVLEHAASGPRWHDDIGAVPDAPFALIANEFFDALPIRQFVRTEHGWHERLVGLDANRNLTFELAAAPAVDPFQDAGFKRPAPGAIGETRPAAKAVMAKLCGRFANAPGAVLILDYGHTASGPGDTLQAVARHRRAGPLDAPGQVDLTAHVDFAALARTAAAHGGQVHGPIAQGVFLNRLGIDLRAEMLAKTASARQKNDIAVAVARLVDEHQMGSLFKVLAVTSGGLAPPAAFTDEAPT